MSGRRSKPCVGGSRSGQIDIVSESLLRAASVPEMTCKSLVRAYLLFESSQGIFFMASLYPSWIEIPVADLARALAFYRAVFGLTDTPLYEEEPSMRIAVLLPSDKSVRAPGVSLVESPFHTPDGGGLQVNFHIGEHAILESALKTALAHGGTLISPLVDMGDGVHYLTLRDSAGNPIALSSYEPLEE